MNDLEEREQSVASRVCRDLIDGGLELFTFEDTAYVLLDGREVCPVRSRRFRRWLTADYYEKCKGTLGNSTIETIVATLDGVAAGRGNEVVIHTRTAEYRGRYYLDLGDSTFRAVEISERGWQIINDCPVRFIRRKGMAALPEPVRGGNINDLRRFLNYGSQEGWVLLLAWLVTALRPKGPYPVLNLTGEQGCAKSTASRVLRRLVDPNMGEIRNVPTNQDDLMIAAKNSWLIAYDNITSIPEWMSNAFCVLSTGGSNSKRELYTNDDENIITVQRPIILNGIGDLNARPDLLDRTVVVTLPVIRDDKRQDEEEFWAAFEDARPALLGALLDAMVEGLQNLSRVNLREKPRMADFAKWVAACESGLGLKSGTFLRVYMGNRDEAQKAALDAYPISAHVFHLVEVSGGTALPASTLLNTFVEWASTEELRNPKWPKDAARLSGQLTQIAPAMRSSGIHIDREHSGKRKIIIAPLDADLDAGTPKPDAVDAGLDASVVAGARLADAVDAISGDCPPASSVEYPKKERERGRGGQQPDLPSIPSTPPKGMYSSQERDEVSPRTKSEALTCEGSLSGRAAKGFELSPGENPLTPAGPMEFDLAAELFADE